MQRVARIAFLVATLLGTGVAVAESLWVEAEHFEGIRGSCWPMGRPEMKKTAGHWGISGPGWAAEWNMGGESGFLSIAAGADDDRATAVANVEIPEDGRWFVWVRYGDWRERTERFQVRIEQPGAAPWTGRYGERAVVEEDNEMKLYWGWAFAWDRTEATLRRGPARITLATTTRDPEPRQVDVVVLTTDAGYRPRIKERPRRHDWDLLAEYRRRMPEGIEPLTRNCPAVEQPGFAVPEAWRVNTFRDRGFLYLWNVDSSNAVKTWLGDAPGRVRFPFHVGDDETRKEFEKLYGGRDDVPIFSDPRIVPTFHGVGGGAFATDPKTGEVNELGRLLARWLDRNSDRPFAMMMNYHGGTPVGPKGVAEFTKYRNRYVGAIAGESMGYFYVDDQAMRRATESAQTRRQLVAALSPPSLEANAAKYRAIYGRDLDRNPYEEVIPCPSVGSIADAPIAALWGARTIGYESSSMPFSLLPMRWAFLRGAARQSGAMTATYRSCNFGDSATIFSNVGSFDSPQNILDNYYSVYAGAGMTWYKMDLWYQYQAGSSMFYHEQGFDEFWKPGGTTAAGVRPVELSPKGKLVDRFLRLTAAEPNRGHPYTPVAFLVDFAHGWEPSPFWPNAFQNWHQHADRFRPGLHEQMLREYMGTAWYPIGPESEKPMTGTNEVYVPGVFGDLFDVVYAYPDVARWRTVDTYPAVIAAGEIELTEPEGRRLAQYVENGGTLLVAQGQFTGPGVAALQLPAVGAVAEASSYRWMHGIEAHPAQRFRYRPLAVAALANPAAGLRPLATTPDGACFCAAIDRGRGRLIYLSVDHGLGIDRQAVPVVPRLFAHLTRGLSPVEVQGDVQWAVNRAGNRWLVLLMNPAGQVKPQQGITPTDTRENRAVTIRGRAAIRSARDRLQPDDRLDVHGNAVRCEVIAGGVRLIELQ